MKRVVCLLIAGLFFVQLMAFEQVGAASKAVIKSGSEYDYPPFCVVTQDGKADGFSVELLRAALSALNLDVEFKTGEWDPLKKALREGTIQVLPLVGRSPEREAVFDFTFPYLTLHGAVFVRKGDTRIKQVSDLSDKTVVVMRGDNAEEFARRTKISSSIVAVETYTQAMQMLEAGKYDAVIAQRLMGIYLLDKIKIKKVVPLDFDLKDLRQDFCFAVRDGDRDLLSTLNEGLSIVIANGTFDRLHKKWFGPLLQEQITFKNALKYILPYLIMIIVVIVLLSFFLLRTELKRRTKNLVQEIDERRRAEEALRNSENEAKRLAQENVIMAEIGRIISSSLNIDEVYERFTKEVAKLISFDRIVINAIDIEKGTTAVAYATGLAVSARQIGFSIPLAGTATAECLRTRSSMLIQPENIDECIARFPGLLPTFQAGFRSIIVAPLISRDQFIGVLTLRSLKPKAYSDQDVRLTEKVANQIAGAIANAQLFTERKRAEQETAILAEIGRVISSIPEIDQVYERFAAEAQKLIPFDRITVSLCNIRENIINVVYVSGADLSSYKQGDFLPLKGTLVELLLRKRTGQIIQSEKIDDIASQIPSFFRNFQAGLRSLIGVPLINKNEAIGILYFWSKTPNAYTERDLQLAKRVGIQIAGAIANAQLFLEQKRVEEALRQTGEFLSLATAAGGVGIWQLDIVNNKLIWDDQMFYLYGTKPESFSGAYETWKERVHPEDMERSDTEVQMALRGEKEFDTEFRVVWPDDTIHHINARARVHRSSAGQPIKLIGTNYDITDRKRMEEEKRNLEERLQRSEKMESLGTLAGGVAHDLNNVLGVIVGYSEMILDQVDKSSPLRRGLENIMNGGLKSAAIVDDLLTLARRGVQGRSILNLNKIIFDCQQSPEFANLSTHHPAVKIQINLETDLLNISGSSVHLGKTLYNLISNASEALTKGGIVTIKTTNQYLDKPIQGYDQIQTGDYVVLSVSDTGEGISESDLKRIFEPFYTKKIMGRSGTGLGLSVVWGTVKDHNGYINVQSEKGKGSTFTLYFPVTREEITAEAVSVAISEYMGKGESILVVDDVKEQRDLAAGMLQKLNYNVSGVASGEEAVAYMKEHEVDLIVLDMIMDPGMDGLDTYRNVLAIHPKQKAIIVSGFSESDRVKTAEGLGAGAYVRKPYIKEKLGLAVRKELDRSI